MRIMVSLDDFLELDEYEKEKNGEMTFIIEMDVLPPKGTRIIMEKILNKKQLLAIRKLYVKYNVVDESVSEFDLPYNMTVSGYFLTRDSIGVLIGIYLSSDD